MTSEYKNIFLDVSGEYATQWVNTLSIETNPQDSPRANSLADLTVEEGPYTDRDQCYDRRIFTDDCGVYCFLSGDRKIAAVSLPMTYDHLDLSRGAIVAVDAADGNTGPFLGGYLALPGGILTVLPHGDGNSNFHLGDANDAKKLADGMRTRTDSPFENFLDLLATNSAQNMIFTINPAH
jgi:hypothetical protein